MARTDGTVNAPADHEVVDAEVVDETASREVAIVPRRGEVLRPLDVGEQKAAMDLYQSGLREILDDSDYQGAGRNRDGTPRKFVKKSGWRKIAAWFDLSIELLRDQVERDEHGNVTRACVWARAVAPSGRAADGDGYCDSAEERFQDARGRQKLENDLRGTATTRAVNRAISNLVGMGDVSAEEISGSDLNHDTGLPFGPKRDDAIVAAASSACIQLCDGDVDRGKQLWAHVVKDLGGYMPQAAAMTLIAVASLPTAAMSSEQPELS